MGLLKKVMITIMIKEIEKKNRGEKGGGGGGIVTLRCMGRLNIFVRGIGLLMMVT